MLAGEMRMAEIGQQAVLPSRGVKWPLLVSEADNMPKVLRACDARR